MVQLVAGTVVKLLVLVVFGTPFSTVVMGSSNTELVPILTG